MAKIETSLNFLSIFVGISGFVLVRFFDLRYLNGKRRIRRGLNSYVITLDQLVVYGVKIVMLAVNNEIILHEADLLNSAGVVIVSAVDEAVDIHKPRRCIENDVENRCKSEYDREEIEDDMLSLFGLIAARGNTGKKDKDARNYQMHSQISNKITHAYSLLRIFFFRYHRDEISADIMSVGRYVRTYLELIADAQQIWSLRA